MLRMRMLMMKRKRTATGKEPESAERASSEARLGHCTAACSLRQTLV